MTPNALAAMKLTGLLVGLAIFAFGAFVFIVLGPRERDGEDLDEGSGFLEWIVRTAIDGWDVTTEIAERLWNSRVGNVAFTALFFVAGVLVFLPVGFYVRAVSALRKAVRA